MMEFFQSDLEFRLMLVAIISPIVILVGVYLILNWKKYFERNRIYYSVLSNVINNLISSDDLKILYKDKELENACLYQIVIQKTGKRPFKNQKFGIMVPKESSVLFFDSFEINENGEKIPSKIEVNQNYPYAITGKYKEIVDDKLYYLQILVNQNESDSLVLKFPKNEKFSFDVVSYRSNLYSVKFKDALGYWFSILYFVSFFIWGILKDQNIWSYLINILFFVIIIFASKKGSHFSLRHNKQIWKKGKRKNKK